MDEYEQRIIEIFSDVSDEALNEMRDLAAQRRYRAAGEYNETGLSHYKETKETEARKYETLCFVIANREFYDADKAITEIN